MLKKSPLLNAFYKTLAFTVILFLNFTVTYGQNSCDYILNLNDSFGDGWDISILTITIDGVSTDYTLDGINDDGSFESVVLSINDGASFSVSYSGDDGYNYFENEISYSIVGPEGDLIFADGPTPEIGENVFSTILSCPTCPRPTDIATEVGGVTTEISWTPNIVGGTYFIQYGLVGTPIDSFLTVSTPETSFNLTGLTEDTDYEFYLSLVCGVGDTSKVQGPFPFTTIWLIDVGIAAVISPNTDCALENEQVTVTLTNYGHNPQSLITFRYSVNGMDAGVPMFTDGFFTNVLSTSDTVSFDFDTNYDFSLPGVYEIAAWTEFENDGNINNDTAYLTISSIPLVTNTPYLMDFEIWDGGWLPTGENPSWEFGEPNNVIISEAANGTNAWVTSLDNTYNPNENSFLLSPCFDFSNETVDPVISFSIIYQNESSWDACWLEGSKNGGTTWERIGVVGSGVNWYNVESTNTNPGPNWNGNSNGWLNAEHFLTGFAGEADVRFRFGFSSDGSIQQEGTGIDDISITMPFLNDLSSISVNHTNTMLCGSMNDSITLEIRNAGSNIQTDFDVFYQINNEPVVMETVSGLMLNPGDISTYAFATTFESDIFGEVYDITAWVVSSAEQDISNDTTSFSFSNIVPDQLPMVEDFEDFSLPDGWSSNGNVGSGHNAPSNVLFRNMFSTFTSSFEVISFPIGTISAGQNLTFDYRYVDFPDGTNATSINAGDSLIVQISMDCGETYFTELTINADNHVVSTDMVNMMINLDAYAGEHITVRFFAGWVDGDYFLDLDNINIIGCPDLFEINAMINNCLLYTSPSPRD